MRLISFCVPCYNSQEYMKKCLDSLLVCGDDAEIIIVNDGSTDDTLSIAREYERDHSDIVRVIDKPNGGHGSGVNAGLAVATGLYYKVVDSDDWLNTDALKTLLDTMKANIASGTDVDLYITNFVYSRYDGNRSMRFVKNFPTNRVFDWSETKPLKGGHMLLMHSLVYNTERLRLSNTVLPEHTFYVDNLFAYKPLPFMRTVYYLDIDLYMYYIGRPGQSVSMNNMIARYEQQMRVMELMLYSYTYDELSKMSKGLRKIMYHCLEVIMLNTAFFTTAKYSAERKRQYYHMWKKLKQTDKKLYKKLKHHTLVCLLNVFTFRGKGRVTTISYKLLCRRLHLGA